MIARCLILSVVMNCSLFAESCYISGRSFPLMGDWVGRFHGPLKGYLKKHPQLSAQLIPVRGGTHYRVVMLPRLYTQSRPYLSKDVGMVAGKVSLETAHIKVVFEGDQASGQIDRNGEAMPFTLEKVPFKPKSVGKEPPSDAVILFDGTDFSHWNHRDGRAVTWDLINDSMQVVTQHNALNKVNKLGGDIFTKDRFGSLYLHVEFRYPVEPDAAGQSRGNSGLFVDPIGEIQILNNYAGMNYWDECGAFYKKNPAKLNAVGPPLAWQSYDVEIELVGEKRALITVYLNGRLIHNKTEMPCNETTVMIGLQDHTNKLQFRNVWLVEK